MGFLFSRQNNEEKQIQKPQKSKIQNVDIVKIKLKQARDNINAIIKKKQLDVQQVDKKIKQLLPKYQQNHNKKPLVPLLQTKKDLQKMIETAAIRSKLVSDKLRQVQLQQMDIDTINVLDQSNKFVKELQNQMEKKDWRGILEESKNKYDLEWPQREDIQEDPAFQQMWNQLGGNKLHGNKLPANKVVNVNTNVSKQQLKNTNLIA